MQKWVIIDADTNSTFNEYLFTDGIKAQGIAEEYEGLIACPVFTGTFHLRPTRWAQLNRLSNFLLELKKLSENGPLTFNEEAQEIFDDLFDLVVGLTDKIHKDEPVILQPSIQLEKDE